MSHICHATICNSWCKPEHLMCPTHWRMVPAETKAAVLRHYRPGQCDDKRPSQEWFNAANLAVAQVAQACNMPMSRHHRELLESSDAQR